MAAQERIEGDHAGRWGHSWNSLLSDEKKHLADGNKDKMLKWITLENITFAYTQSVVVDWSSPSVHQFVSLLRTYTETYTTVHYLSKTKRQTDDHIDPLRDYLSAKESDGFFLFFVFFYFKVNI